MISHGIDKMMKVGGLGLVSEIIDRIEQKTTRKENFSTRQGGGSLYMIFNSLIVLVAFFLAFKCGGFMDFMGACCCSICYIAYRLANPCS